MRIYSEAKEYKKPNDNIEENKGYLLVSPLISKTIGMGACNQQLTHVSLNATIHQHFPNEINTSTPAYDQTPYQNYVLST